MQIVYVGVPKILSTACLYNLPWEFTELNQKHIIYTEIHYNVLCNKLIINTEQTNKSKIRADNKHDLKIYCNILWKISN